MSGQAPLDTQQVVVKLGKADLKTSDKLAVAGTLVVAENTEMTFSGRYQRRPGTLYVDTVANAVRLHGGERETMAATLDTLYSDVDGAFQARGSIAGFRGDFDPVNNSAFEQTCHSMARVMGLDFDVWAEVTGIYYSCRDSLTGAYVVSEGTVTTAAGNYAPQVIAVGQYALISYVNDGTIKIAARRIDSNVPGTLSAEYTIEGVYNQVAKSLPDVIVKSGTVVCYGYVNGPIAAVTATLKEWDVSTMAVTATRTQALGYAQGASATHSAGFLQGMVSSSYALLVTKATGVGHAVNDDPRVVVATAPFGLASAAAVAIHTTGSSAVDEDWYNCTGFVDSAGTWHMLTEASFTTASARAQVWYFTRTSGGVVATVGILFGFRLLSKVFRFGARDLVLYSGTVQSVAGPDSTYFLAEVQNGGLVGRALAGLADEKTINAARADLRGLLPMVTVTATSALVPSVYFLSTTQRAAALVQFDLQPVARYLEVAGVTLIPASTIHMYDGIGISELGFHFPPGISALVTAAAGGLQIGTYWYRATWEWVDARGRLHRSAASAPVSLAVGSAGLRGRITVGTLVTTLKRAPIPQAVLALFRSTINPSSSSAAAYFRCATVANDPTAASLVIDDTLTDAQIIVGDRLYVLGNTVLGNASPPPANALAAWGGRAWACERDVLWFSKSIQDNFGVAFPAENFLQISDDRGDIVTTSDSGQRLAVFKATAIYVVSGEGPDDTGRGAFSPVRRLSAPLGARSAVSVISTELGVFFQDDASGHIWLLPPEGDPEPIGREVEALSMVLTISDAVVVSDKRQVRFFSLEGTTLTYDLTHQQWTWATKQPAAAAAMIAGVCNYVTPTVGDIRADDPETFVEGDDGLGGGTVYRQALETSWITPNQVAGQVRTFAVQATGEELGEHDLTMTLGYRFGDEEETRVVPSSGLVTAFGYRVEGRPAINRQAATAIKVRLEDDAPATPGFALEALTLTVGIRGKRGRLPKANIGTP